jgi:hypothetical protein
MCNVQQLHCNLPKNVTASLKPAVGTRFPVAPFVFENQILPLLSIWNQVKPTRPQRLPKLSRTPCCPLLLLKPQFLRIGLHRNSEQLSHLESF